MYTLGVPQNGSYIQIQFDTYEKYMEIVVIDRDVIFITVGCSPSLVRCLVLSW